MLPVLAALFGSRLDSCLQASCLLACFRAHLDQRYPDCPHLQGQPTKVVVGMYSGEGEYVQFVAPCICDGPVEVGCARLSVHASL